MPDAGFFAPLFHILGHRIFGEVMTHPVSTVPGLCWNV